MRNTFLYKLYQYDRRLFFAVAAFSALTLLFNLLGDEATPFFVWGMYSEKEDTLNRYAFPIVKINDGQLVDYSSGYGDNQRFFMQTPLNYYIRIKENHGADPTMSFLKQKLGLEYEHLQPLARKVQNGPRQQALFMDWYARYLQECTGQPVNRLEVYLLSGHYGQDQRFISDSSYLFDQWQR